MAITVSKAFDKNNPDYREFICDDESDVANLPTDCAAGSSAMVIEPFSLYIINSRGEWRKI